MYAWQQIDTFTKPITPGRLVMLNEAWPGHTYLKREFGFMFPGVVAEVSSDLYTVQHGSKKLAFARQTIIGA